MCEKTEAPGDQSCSRSPVSRGPWYSLICSSVLFPINWLMYLEGVVNLGLIFFFGGGGKQLLHIVV